MQLTLTVSDSWQRRGVGRRLLDRLIDAARQQGHEEMVARILATNRPMLALEQAAGFSGAVDDELICQRLRCQTVERLLRRL
jgi:L-amino acid N-acyltransferase YncA